MNNQAEPMKWITEMRSEAPADRQVSLAIGGVLGSFILFWGGLGFIAGDRVHQGEPVARKDIETVQLLPRGGSLDDPNPLPVPDLPPVDLPEGASEPGAVDYAQPLVADEGPGEDDHPVPVKPAKKGGLWNWVTSLFDPKKEPARQANVQTAEAVVGDPEAVQTGQTQPVQAHPAPPPAQPQPAQPEAAQPQAPGNETETLPSNVRPQPGIPWPSRPKPPVRPVPAPSKPPAPVAPIKPAPIVPAPGQRPGNTNNNTNEDPTRITEMFARLRIAPALIGEPFNRDIFGHGWVDIDENQCSTRNDILARDLNVTDQERGCKVISGTLTDPYTGKVLEYLDEGEPGDEIVIDHVVSLENAWVSGGQDLTPNQRDIFMNDPLNLLAVSREAVEIKGAKHVADWLPDNEAFRCDYIARQVAVKARYGLWVTSDEHAAMAKGLASCSTELRVDGDTIVSGN